MVQLQVPSIKMSGENEDVVPLMIDKRRSVGNLGLSPMRRKKGENKSRFSEKQVKLLEAIFQVEKKIEPMKKVQLAEELGLDPRQIAIWFQNRRVRWKSKQLEKEFRILKGNYENLASQVGSLKEENLSLHLLVQNSSLALERQGRSTSNQSGTAEKTYDNRENMGFLGQDQLVQKYQSLGVLGDSSQASADQEWHGVDATHVFDQSCCAQPWSNFWNC